MEGRQGQQGGAAPAQLTALRKGGGPGVAGVVLQDERHDVAPLGRRALVAALAEPAGRGRGRGGGSLRMGRGFCGGGSAAGVPGWAAGVKARPPKHRQHAKCPERCLAPRVELSLTLPPPASLLHARPPTRSRRPDPASSCCTACRCAAGRAGRNAPPQKGTAWGSKVVHRNIHSDRLGPGAASAGRRWHCRCRAARRAGAGACREPQALMTLEKVCYI